MKTAVVVFPGSNCDRDMQVALRRASGQEPVMLWHKDTKIPEGIDLIALPGGFSFGDYLRCGAIASRSPIMREVAAFAQKGGFVLGVCNGLPSSCRNGSFARSPDAQFNTQVRLSHRRFDRRGNPERLHPRIRQGRADQPPVAHHDGCYVAGEDVLKQLEDQQRVAFRYAETVNGSQQDIAGILSENRRVLGMMPHPERAEDPLLGNTDGARLFSGLIAQTVSA